MPEICRTDLLNTIRYLEDAVKVYCRSGTSTRIHNRVRLLNIHIRKLKNIHRDDPTIQQK